MRPNFAVSPAESGFLTAAFPFLARAFPACGLALLAIGLMAASAFAEMPAFRWVRQAGAQSGEAIAGQGSAVDRGASHMFVPKITVRLSPRR